MKKLLIAATGRCVWNDVRQVYGVLKYCDVMAVNDMILHWPRSLTYAVSLHAEFLCSLLQARKNTRRNKPVSYGFKKHEGVDYHGRFYDGLVRGSGFYAAAIGLHLGYEEILLAGMPYDNTGHFQDPPEPLGTAGFTLYEYKDKCKKCWEGLAEKANGRIKAISGNLVECFGVTDSINR